MSSSKRSSSIPVSFDRFRVKSIQFPSPFCNHQNKKCIKQNSERILIRKVQVHPNDVNSSKSEQIDHNNAHLFYANKRSNTKTTSITKTSQNNKCQTNIFNNRSTSNIIGVLDFCKVPITNTSCISQSKTSECLCPPTPCMIRYRDHSLPTIVPTRVIQYPRSFDDSIKPYDFDHTDYINI